MFTILTYIRIYEWDEGKNTKIESNFDITLVQKISKKTTTLKNNGNMRIIWELKAMTTLNYYKKFVEKNNNF